MPETDRQAVLDTLIADIRRHGNRLTTGDVGTRYLFRVLANDAHPACHELLYTMLNHYDVPGYGYQIKLGHTTLTEQWNPEYGSSMNHFMMGHLNNLLVPWLVGIQIAPAAVTIAPHPVGDLTWARGATECNQGRIAAAWRIEEGTFHLDIDLPEGINCTVVMPYSAASQAVSQPGHHHFQTPVPAATEGARPF